MPGPNATTAELLAQLEATLLAMHGARVEAGGRPGSWNRLVDKAQRLHLALRTSAEGREGITALMSHNCDTARGWAATWALFWDEPLARAELERQGAQASLTALSARTTLSEFDAGRLDPTWQPETR